MPDGSRSFAPPRREDLERVAALYRQHHRFVSRVLRRCGVPDAELDDALQETFLVAYRRLAEFEARATERTWLYAIAVRVASTLRRGLQREHARREKAGGEMHGKLDADPEAELTRAQAAHLLDRLLDALDDKKRTVFVLAELEGLKAAEISRIVGVNVRTVHSRLRLAREGFATAVERMQAQERGRRHRARLRARSLAERAEPPRSTAALGLVLAKIESGAAPLLPAWKTIALAPVATSSFFVPLAATLAIGGAGLVLTAKAVEPPPQPEPIASASTEPTPQDTTAEQPGHARSNAPGARRTSGSDAAQPEAATVGSAVEPATAASVAAPLAADAALNVAPSSGASDTALPDAGDAGPQRDAPADNVRDRRATSTPATRGEPSPSPTSEAPDPFGAEVAGLEAARKAIRGGHYDQALAKLDALDRRFPSGAFAADRASTRVHALCKADRPDEARAYVRTLPEGGDAARTLTASCR